MSLPGVTGSKMGGFQNLGGCDGVYFRIKISGLIVVSALRSLVA